MTTAAAPAPTSKDPKKSATAAPLNATLSPALQDLLATLTALEGWLAHSALEELEIEQDGRRLRLRKPGLMMANMVASTPTAAAPAVAAPQAAPAETGHIYKAQLVGTFYSASGPDAAPFVQVGTAVKMGQVLGIIEAMKTMNQVTADVDGTIQKIMVKNGQAVEFGQPLFVIA